MQLNTPIQEIPYVGPKHAKYFEKLGIKTLKDLLFYFPRNHEDFSKITPINQASTEEKYAFQAKILTIKTYRSPVKKMFITEAIIEDETGALPVIWFNQRFIIQQLKKGYIANFIGNLKNAKKGLILTSPAYEVISRNESSSLKKIGIHSERIVPVYRENPGVTSKYLRFLIWAQLKNIKDIADFLPKEILKRNNFISLARALKEIHFPTSLVLLKKAEKRLSFNEFFLIRLFLEKQRKFREQYEKSYSVPFQENLVKSFVKNLSFPLTIDQKKAAWQIIKDLEKPYPMQRLLEGDVGSGKTIVAAIASLSVISQGYQVAIMAPTEVLARQHFNQLAKDLRNIEITLALLIGAEARILKTNDKNSKKIQKEKLLKNLANGTIKLVIGTHALIQKGVHFKNLAFLVVDEQHRFGVEQRSMLLNAESGIKNQENNNNFVENRKLKIDNHQRPHLLSMSATPIPRTLSLVFYGDLNISQLRELPKGRRKILTSIIFPKERPKIYQFIKKEVLSGRQAFIICPLIEESENFQARAAEKEFLRLKKEIFPDLNLGLLHGRMKSKEKKEIMKSFQDKKIDILVSTSVIEVGIDIPNATIMMIEGAERFGLAQLHQLRGRVGRSTFQSYCFLLTDMPIASVSARLQALVTLEDGFKLAEKDLQLRGPGDFIGNRQSGIPDLIMASLKNIELIELAKKEASMLLEQDSNLNHYPLLRKKIEQMERKIHLE